MKKKNRKNYFYNSSGLNESDIQSNKSSVEEQKNKRIEYEFNILEVIGASFCKCCLSKKLKLKTDLNEKANSCLCGKMEISLYIRNMMLFDIINETLFDSENKDIINFLCRPSVTIKNSEKNELSLFYKKYKESDFDIFYNEMIQLMNKPDKKNADNKLISLSNRHLKTLSN